MECQPTFKYGRDSHRVELSSAGAVFRSETFSLALFSPTMFRRAGHGVAAEFTLNEGELQTFPLQIVESPRPRPGAAPRVEALLSGRPSPMGDNAGSYVLRSLSRVATALEKSPALISSAASLSI